ASALATVPSYAGLFGGEGKALATTIILTAAREPNNDRDRYGYPCW
ncbi:MAG: hypothetical protein QOE61_3159, partial [Micromonosporaceae bacterium]|nr:hypothetical protein [Micromonosporaceae bacterium]